MTLHLHDRQGPTRRLARAGTAAPLLLLLLLVLGCSGEAGTEPEEPDAGPANVVIVSVGEMTGADGEWHIPLVVENTGGEGRLRMRFAGGSCVSTYSPMTIGAEATWDRDWVSGCAAQPEEAITLTLLEGEFVETDRAPIPQPGS